MKKKFEGQLVCFKKLLYRNLYLLSRPVFTSSENRMYGYSIALTCTTGANITINIGTLSDSQYS